MDILSSPPEILELNKIKLDLHTYPMNMSMNLERIKCMFCTNLSNIISAISRIFFTITAGISLILTAFYRSNRALTFFSQQVIVSSSLIITARTALSLEFASLTGMDDNFFTISTVRYVICNSFLLEKFNKFLAVFFLDVVENINHIHLGGGWVKCYLSKHYHGIAS